MRAILIGHDGAVQFADVRDERGELPWRWRVPVLKRPSLQVSAAEGPFDLAVETREFVRLGVTMGGIAIYEED